MERLTKLPIVGSSLARLRATRLWRIYEHLDSRKWTRLAAAITFNSFLALFPMLAVGAAVAAALLSHGQMTRLQNTLTEQVPGISDQLELQSLVDNAGTSAASRADCCCSPAAAGSGCCARACGPCGTWRRTPATSSCAARSTSASCWASASSGWSPSAAPPSP